VLEAEEGDRRWARELPIEVLAEHRLQELDTPGGEHLGEQALEHWLGSALASGPATAANEP
jgi:hypothetical protein